MDLLELLPLSERLVELARDHAYVAIAAIVLGGIVRLAKVGEPESLWDRVPKRVRPVVVALLGIVAGAAEAITGGQDPHVAVVHGLLAAAVAMMGHSLLVDGAMGGREVGGGK